MKSDERTNDGMGFTGFVLAALAGMLLMYGAHRAYWSAAKEAFVNPPTWDDSESSVPVSSNDPYWGSRYAPVTIVLFSDYQCPHCKNVEQTFELLKAEYGGAKLRIVWKHTPLAHPKARAAHAAAQAVYALGGQDAFWKFHELVFDNNDELSAENFERWASQAGVDGAMFTQAHAAGTHAAQVDEHLAQARSVGVTGTPASFVNGALLRGAVPYDKLKAVVDEQMRIAEQALAAGTPRDRLYVTVSLKNKPKKASTAAAAESKSGASKEPAPAKKGRSRDDDQPHRVELGSSVTRGPLDALVTIVEFGDFECAYTASAEAQLRELLETYDGKLRLAWKHRPLPRHKGAVSAALLAMAAREQKGDTAFWDAHALLLSSTAQATARARGGQPRLDPVFNDQGLLEHAGQLGLELDRTRAVLAEANRANEPDGSAAAREHMAQLEADLDLAEALDVGGTPHFFVNGRRLVGAQSIEQFKRVIDEELRKAEALVATGVPAARVYEETIGAAPLPAAPITKLIDPAPTNAPWKGAHNARVQLHVFSDFECPYCKQVETPLGQVERAFADRVKIIWRDMPLGNHKLAPVAANAAREAMAQKGMPAFWAYHDELFKLTRTADFSRAGFERVAQAQGLDLAAFRAALDASTHQAAIDEDARHAASYEITGTPAFVVTYARKDDKLEGLFISGALPFSRFQKTIHQALAQAGVPAPRRR